MWKPNPESLKEEVEQNLRMILGTPKGSVPLHRDFGIDFSLLDFPFIQAIPKIKKEVILAIKKWEPRIEVISVKVEKTQDGGVYFTVEWRLKNGRGGYYRTTSRAV